MQAPWILEAISTGNRFHFRTRDPRTHNALNVGLALSLVGMVAATLALARHVPAGLYVPLAGVAFGVEYFALIVLVVHEASHGMFVVSRTRGRAAPWNRLAGWAVSIPFSINYARHWEEGHPIHHERPMADDDPQVENLLTGRPLAMRLLKMLLIPGYVFAWNPSRRYRTHRWLSPLSTALWIAALAGAAFTLGWAAAAALFLGLQVLGALNQLKGSMEHGGDIAREDNRFLRSRTSLFALRRLVMPCNISLHFEHHLNQSVPWYLLPRYGEALRGVVPAAVQRELFNDRVLEQLRGRLGALSEAARRAALGRDDDGASPTRARSGASP